MIKWQAREHGGIRNGAKVVMVPSNRALLKLRALPMCLMSVSWQDMATSLNEVLKCVWRDLATSIIISLLCLFGIEKVCY